MKFKLYKGAAFVTFATLLVKVLSILYKIPYQNLTGDKGFYIYQQMYPVYALIIGVSSFALPLAISENVVKQNKKEMVVCSSFYFLMTTAILLSLSLCILNPYIGKLMGDNSLSNVLVPIIPLILLVPFLSTLRGLNYGDVNTVHKAGISLVIEQLFRVFFITIILILFMKLYITNPYLVAQYSYYGFSIGIFIATIFLMFPFKLQFLKRRYFHFKTGLNVFKRGLFLLFSASILLFLQVVDSFTILNQLSNSMSLEAAMITKGIYDRGLPIIQTVVFFVPALLASMMPHLHNKKSYNKLFMLILFLAIPATAGVIMVLKEINILLFQDDKHTFVLQVNALVVLLYSGILTFTTILKNEKKNVFIILFGIFCKIILNYYLINLYGIIGAAVSSVVSLSMILILFLIIYKNVIQIKSVFLLKIIFSTFFMIFTIYLVSLLNDHLVIKVLSGITSYFFMSYLLRNKSDFILT